MSSSKRTLGSSNLSVYEPMPVTELQLKLKDPQSMPFTYVYMPKCHLEVQSTRL